MLGGQQERRGMMPETGGWGPTMFHGKGDLELGLEDQGAFDLGRRSVCTLPTVVTEELGVGKCRNHSGTTFHKRFCC